MRPELLRRLLESSDIARQRGGACLSPTTGSRTDALRWTCAVGHEWTASIEAVLGGAWCNRCERRASFCEQRLAELQAAAARRGGVCLSREYLRQRTRMRWRCAHDHEWEAEGDEILRGSWCPFCSGRRTDLAALQALAAERGGECLSTTAGRKSDPHDWRCDKGHTWSETPSALRRGKWCPTCTGKAPVTLATLRAWAQARGGECLAEQYLGTASHVPWRCEFGHVWETTPATIKRGSWCPHCSGRFSMTLQQLKAMARERGGRCLATSYDSHKHVRWRCAEGHTWSALPSKIAAGGWCPYCARPGGKRRWWTFADLLERVREQGGRVALDLPGDTYVRGHTKVDLQCAYGHNWTTQVAAIHKGNWCPHCAGVARGSLEEVQARAHARGGRCLSTEYITCDKHLRFECAAGHQWDARPTMITRTWCPQCAPSAPIDLATVQAKAEAHGGRCLSLELPGGGQKLSFKCAKGHEFMALAKSVHAGHWCPTCRGVGTYTLERARKVAAQRGGECLSTACEKSTDRLRWRCAVQHTWTSPAYVVIRDGCWCRRCSASNRKRPGD